MMHSLALLLLCLPYLAQGYIYTKCELARDLLAENVAKSELHKWVCMAWYESSFNTAAVNQNSPNSVDHGLFQINSYWNCDPQNGKPAKNGCGHPCSDYKNTDLTDDVACIKKLKREHKGWGFSMGYTNNCQSKTSSYLSECGIPGLG
ncbi:LYSC1-like protein [Mya arenaria]|uniref:lysozyme n=1 Tax=Mya arenaria TaxID=6604 RepID=A0ABY7FZG1_MYAAR|nr:lysozyme C-1-like [Mya arenaria]XP_052781642.1 lysozyme C-1-like [Mya arenaria]WAR26442.1 LYSC1-like protein [Mya arenaria]